MDIDMKWTLRAFNKGKHVFDKLNDIFELLLV